MELWSLAAELRMGLWRPTDGVTDGVKELADGTGSRNRP